MDHNHHYGIGDPTNSTMDMGMCNMKMTFHLDYINDCVMFDGWVLKSVGDLVGSVVGVFLLAILYEALKYYREYLFKQSYICSSIVTEPKGGIEAHKDGKDIQQPVRRRMLSINHFVQTGLHIVQFTLSYFLMLIFMTYDAWLCIAVATGTGVGFFIFGWKKPGVLNNTEHCH